MVGQAAPINAAAQQPVQVMVVGTFHMANPGHDLHNVQVGDVLLPRAQEQIASVVQHLATFHATRVMTEWPQALADERFAKYTAGTLPPSRNEVVQLGFRLARASSLGQGVRH